MVAISIVSITESIRINKHFKTWLNKLTITGLENI